MASTKIQLANVRNRANAKVQAVERTLTMSGGGIVLGAAEGAGKLPVAIAGIPSKLALGVAGHIIGATASGGMGRLARNIGDACLTCYSYAAGKSKSVIAGYDEDLDAD